MEELTEALAEETETYDELIRTARRKRDAVIRNELAGLSAAAEYEDAAARHLNRLDKRRTAAAAAIADSLGLGGGGVTLAGISAAIPDEGERSGLNALAEGLRARVTELRRINAENRALIENALAYIEFSMNVMRGAAASVSARGGGIETESACLLDTRS
ncbi:MAG: flagellar protein FlgN [Clostridiales bacterium]|jgi:flagellar biosynthesis/type III secretory pathway chaperone|nr:flagellar protein FlgN [Clostridiales bacterium]